MIQFLFNVIIVIVGVFIIVCLISLMVRVVVSLIRKLFPNALASKMSAERSKDEH